MSVGGAPRNRVDRGVRSGSRATPERTVEISLSAGLERPLRQRAERHRQHIRCRTFRRRPLGRSPPEGSAATFRLFVAGHARLCGLVLRDRRFAHMQYRQALRLPGACGPVNRLADGKPDQCRADGREHRDASLRDVGLVRLDEGHRLHPSRHVVAEIDLAAHANGVGGMPHLSRLGRRFTTGPPTRGSRASEMSAVPPVL